MVVAPAKHEVLVYGSSGLRPSHSPERLISYDPFDFAQGHTERLKGVEV